MNPNIRAVLQRAGSDDQGDIAAGGQPSDRCGNIGVPSCMVQEAVPKRGAFLPLQPWLSHAQLCKSDFHGILGQPDIFPSGTSKLNWDPEILVCGKHRKELGKAQGEPTLLSSKGYQEK